MSNQLKVIGKQLLVVLFLNLLIVGIVFCAPDPDLFDGRVSASQEGSEGDSGSSEGAVKAEQAIGEVETAEVSSIDSGTEEITAASGGQPVDMQSSKQSGGSSGAPRASSEADSSGIGSGGGSQTGVSEEEVASIGEVPARSFDEFGFGGASGDSGQIEKIEINTSKLPSSEASAEVASPVGGTQVPPTGTSGSGVEGAKPHLPSGSVDFGTNVPAGL